MTSPARILTPLLTLVAALAIAAPAHASPDGDDDPTYNAGNAFGTQYSGLDKSGFFTYLGDSQPVTDQAPDGASITANLIAREPIRTVRGEAPDPVQYLRLTRFDINGQPSGLSGDGTREVTLDLDLEYTELLDIRVLQNGTFVVLIRASTDGPGDLLQVVRLNADGTPIPEDTSPLIPGLQYLDVPAACEPEEEDTRGGWQMIRGYVSAARVNADGAVSALWDCYVRQEEPPGRGFGLTRRGVVVAQSGTAGTETDSVGIPGVFGEDLELGTNGDPYALVAATDDNGNRGLVAGSSQVHRVTLSGGTLTGTGGTPFYVPGAPVDLAVDSQGRSLVWTAEVPRRGAGPQVWDIYRLVPDRSALDTSWGNAGKAEVSDPRLDIPRSGGNFRDEEQSYLTVRPGDKVLVTDGYRRQDDEDEEQQAPRELNSFRNGIIAGLTSAGQTDTGFATNGFKVFEYTGSYAFDRIGEPTLQSDGKVLVPHTNENNNDGRSSSARIAPPPTDDQKYVGVTRLVGGASSGTGTVPGIAPSSTLRPSATPTICGRRAISLVRADVRGRRVKLTGLVGAALYGKTVTIQTDPEGAKSSKFTKTTTVRASSTGSFTAFVPKPKRADFISIRYRAVSGRAKSPALKLPQRLTSRSVRSAAGTITVKGRVKKSVLGKRNRVKIRRLVCGRYRTVGTAKPDADGNYTVKFNATQIRGVAFYRAESMVLRKPGSKTYVIQYARAIAIRTTSQTG